MDKQQLLKIAEKAKVLNVPDNLGLAKVFIEIESAIANIKIPEVDLTAIVNKLDMLENKLDEEDIIELQII